MAPRSRPTRALPEKDASPRLTPAAVATTCSLGSMADLDDLLAKTSRTFALTIPLLPEPCRREVTVAYLVFRVADTFEDAHSWPKSARVAALERLAELLSLPTIDDGVVRPLVAAWLAAQPTTHEGYLELLRHTPAVLAALDALSPAARALVATHALRTARGMAAIARSTDDGGRLRLSDTDALRSYCYVVAGIVGELLTELFLLHAPSLKSEAGALRASAATFGEALQLVNILKDARDDAAEGRVFLPDEGARAPVFALARADLDEARRYVRALQRAGAPRGFVAFTALPVLLAALALERVEAAGPGAKVERAAVFAAIQAMHARLDAGADPFAA
jgi:farnesyl-diphosphate farnesyltransferase